ncbi:serine/threonine-protein kinase [Thalassoglobus sp.]|uniref:serine/threonine-protein kinase n=1 Tax=Thalassoglobus sp. TaxID=2795869 RepID=UPI003AA8C149
MSQFGVDQPASASEGTGLTFVRPLPQSQSAHTEHRPLAPISPRDQVEFASRLFPPRILEDSGSMPSVTGLELGHFVIEERIGRGGMGSVFRAIDKRLDRIVALKVLSPDLSSDPESVLRFQNEARAAARLDHDNIARVHYIGEENGLHFIAFEFVTGTNVRIFISQKGQLSPESVVNYTLQIAEALRHTAAANVVHRDIKPSNIIVSPTGRATLVDLGLARHYPEDQSKDLTVAGTALGTFDYIAPEQAIDARNVDVRSDIYSLGCTMYHMLTGEPPYPKGTMFQKVINHHGPAPPEVTLKNPRVSQQLSRVVQKMMHSNPDERYATPDALIHDLVQIAEKLGLAPTYPEAVVWTTPLFKARNPYWDGTRTWMAVALVLLLFVYLVDQLQPNQTPTLVSDDSTQSQVVDPPTEINSKTTGSTEGPAEEATPSETDTLAQTKPDKPDLSVLPSTATLGSDWPSSFISGDSSNLWKSLAANELKPTPEPKTTPSTIVKVDPETTKVEPRPAMVEENTNRSIPFVVTQSATGETKAYATLAEAFAKADDNSAIEIHVDGVLDIQKKAIQFSGKRVILRGAEDFHPVIRFDFTEELLISGSLTRSVSVFDIGKGGALEVYDVDIELLVDPDTTVDQWSIVKLSPGTDFVARWSSFTMNNPSRIPAALILSPDAEPADFSNLMPERMSERPSMVQIRDSICRGQMDITKQFNLHPLDVSLEETAIAISGTVHRLDGASSDETNMTADSDPGTFISLNHVTAFVGEGILRATTGDHGTLDPVSIDIRNSLIRIERPDQSVVSLAGHLDAALLKDKILWQQHSDRSFVQSEGPLFTVESSANFPLEPQVISPREIGANLEHITDDNIFTVPNSISRTSLHTTQPIAFQLRNRDFNFDNPALKSASDGRNAGVDWTRSGLPESLPLPSPMISENETIDNDL